MWSSFGLQVAEVYAAVGKFPVLRSVFVQEHLPDPPQAVEVFIPHVIDDATGPYLVVPVEEECGELQLSAAYAEQAGLGTFCTNLLIEFEESLEQFVDDRGIQGHGLLDQADDVVGRDLQQE